MLLSSVVRAAVICVGIERASHETIRDVALRNKHRWGDVVSLAQATKKRPRGPLFSVDASIP